MSWALVQSLVSVQKEFGAARGALFYADQHWPQVSDDIHLTGVSYGQVVIVLSRVEQTYLTRLFSEFEGMLRTYLNSRSEVVPSKAFDLVNKVAKRQRANVPDDKRDAVHRVREYRNAIVHTPGSGAAGVSFRQALSALNQYLVSLPDP